MTIDSVAITPGSGEVVATDNVDLGNGAVQVQYVKIIDGTEDGTVPAPVASLKGLAVNPRPTVVRTRVVATVSTTPAYTAGDAIGGELVFANASRVTAQTSHLLRVQITDKAAQSPDLELHLFAASIAGTYTDNAPFDPTDADLADYLGTVTVAAADWKVLTDNAVADVAADLPFKPNATTNLYGYLVIRSAETYVSSTDLAVTVLIRQD